MSEAAPSFQVQYAQRGSSARLPVLNSFRIEQFGEGFRIVDEDGSVYRAQLQVEPITRPPGPAPAALPAVTLSAVRAAPESVAQVISVNAVGTNRGLQQQVTLTGNLVMTNLPGTLRFENQAALLTNQAALRFLLSNARLEGDAVVGATNQVRILAIPSER